MILAAATVRLDPTLPLLWSWDFFTILLTWLANPKKGIRMFLEPVRWHPRRPRAGGKARTKFSSTGGRAPVYRLSLDHFQTVKRILAPDWAQNMLCMIVQFGNNISGVLFVSSYMTAIDSIAACLAHAPKKCTQSGNFQFDINSVYPKTNDAFPKIQAWAHNRYSRLHRSRLR